MSEKIEFEAEVERGPYLGMTQINAPELVVPTGRYRVTLERIEELKPCPFCGGEARIRRPGTKAWSVSCVECMAESIFALDKNLAIAAWNRRADGEV
jgi:Lar family restriction alleviation protein